MDQLPRLGKRELICLLLFTCNYVVFVWTRFLFLWALGMGYVILLWNSLSLPYNNFDPCKKAHCAESSVTKDDLTEQKQLLQFTAQISLFLRLMENTTEVIQGFEG